MKRTPILFILLNVVILLTACNNQAQRLSPQQALDITWKSLEPNTSSHNIDEWKVDEARKVAGGEVVNEFALPPRENCPGPKPPDNQPIKATSEYWYVKFLPDPELGQIQDDTPSASPPPVVTEPNFQAALFLIDIYSGEVVARKLICVDKP